MSQSTNTISDLLESLRSIEAGALAEHTVPDLGAQPSFNRREDFDEHAEMLAREFSGQSLLAFAHAIETVRIRREIALEESLRRYFELWGVAEADLLVQLNTRWLVSACDTFADHGPTAADRAYGLAGALYLNAVKMAETERYIASSAFLPHDWHKVPLNEAQPLFDGVSCLVQFDDMPANLEARVAQCAEDSVAARITAAILRRVRSNDTFVRRLAQSSKDYREGRPQPLAIRIRRRFFR